MTPEQLTKLKEQLRQRIGWLDGVMRNARQEDQMYNYMFYDGEVLAYYHFLHLLDGIELEQKELQ